jgi:hypothetical protein
MNRQRTANMQPLGPPTPLPPQVVSSPTGIQPMADSSRSAICCLLSTFCRLLSVVCCLVSSVSCTVCCMLYCTPTHTCIHARSLLAAGDLPALRARLSTDGCASVFSLLSALCCLLSALCSLLHAFCHLHKSTRIHYHRHHRYLLLRGVLDGETALRARGVLLHHLAQKGIVRLYF